MIDEPKIKFLIAETVKRSIFPLDGMKEPRLDYAVIAEAVFKALRFYLEEPEGIACEHDECDINAVCPCCPSYRAALHAIKKLIEPYIKEKTKAGGIFAAIHEFSDAALKHEIEGFRK